jgi:hypothetical protein
VYTQKPACKGQHGIHSQGEAKDAGKFPYLSELCRPTKTYTSRPWPELAMKRESSNIFDDRQTIKSHFSAECPLEKKEKIKV